MNMSLYQIIKELEETLNQFEVDEETGEVIFDADKIEALNLAKEEKIQNIGYVVLNLKAEQTALQERKKELDKRIKSITCKLDRLNEYIKNCLNGEPFKCVDFEIKFSKSERVEINEEFFNNSFNDKYFTYKAPEPNKVEIKKSAKARCRNSRCYIDTTYKYELEMRFLLWEILMAIFFVKEQINYLEKQDKKNLQANCL